ncbi:MAG TPA: MarR family transcriptional regulator [Opitutaceae bacterium]
MPRAPKPPALTKADYELLARFRYTLRKFLGFSEAAATSRGVTPQQYQALLAIEGFPGRNWVTVGDLAEQMQIAHHSAVGLVNRMETLRLVRRAKSKEDGRKVQVRLTAKGLALLEKLYRAHREELRSVGPRLIGILRRASEPPHRPAATAGYASPACSMPEIDD